jgi:16S rRNA (cytosine967-C5)-methyltransferase
VTPAGRIAAAIDLLAAIEAAPARPADAVANDFFRGRRFIGSGDRRAVSDRVWRVLRTWRRLAWWLADKPTPRLLVAASLLLEGGSLADVMSAFTGGQFAPAVLAPSEQASLRRLQGRTLDHASMSDAVRLELPTMRPTWPLCCNRRRSTCASTC